MRAGKLTYFNGGEAFNNCESKEVLAATKMILLGRSIALPGMRVILSCMLKVRRKPKMNAKGD